MTDWRTEREQALVTLEQSKERGVRNDAAERLHELAVEAPDRWPELTELIPRLLADEQDDVRRVAVALGALMLEPEDAGTFLGLRMKDPSATVRLEAVGQLADLGRPEGRGVLAAGLQDPSFGVRFEAARGMATLRHSAGMEVLVEALEQDALRFRALGALAELATRRRCPPSNGSSSDGSCPASSERKRLARSQSLETRTEGSTCSSGRRDVGTRTGRWRSSSAVKSTRRVRLRSSSPSSET